MEIILHYVRYYLNRNGTNGAETANEKIAAKLKACEAFYGGIKTTLGRMSGRNGRHLCGSVIIALVRILMSQLLTKSSAVLDTQSI